MTTATEDKIKVLESAIHYLRNNGNLHGICDAIMFSCGSLPDVPKFYGITLPPRKYAYCDVYAFSFPLTKAGKQQRIKFLEKAIKKLKKMTQQERTSIIDKIIWSQFKGVRMDNIYYNDRFNALNKLSDSELLKQNPELN